MNSLSPEKRALLERLLKQKGVQLGEESPVKGSEPEEAAMMGVLKKVGSDRSFDGHDPQKYTDKQRIKDVYNAYHEGLRGAIFHDYSFFMNLGYVGTDAPQYSPVALPERMVGRNYVKLVLEVVGDCDLTDRRVLDVGCGRGGMIYAAQKYFRPTLTVGVDLAAGAIDFCRARHRYPNAEFMQGDAENLEFADASFDVVTNIESSHHYEQIEKFYRGVYRILAPKGHFLYTTMLSVDQFGRDLEMLGEIGFVVEREQDITQNVLAACDQDKRGLFGGLNSEGRDAWIANAVALPGSDTYNNMASGKTPYKLFKLRKHDSASPTRCGSGDRDGAV